jgi:uncharacterized protein YjdB
MKRKLWIITFVALIGVFALGMLCGCKEDRTENTSITMSEKEITLYAGEEMRLTVAITPEDAMDKEVEWKTSDGKIAQVENGVVKGIAAGEATITATSNQKSDSCKVIVKEKETGENGGATDSTDSTDSNGSNGSGAEEK